MPTYQSHCAPCEFSFEWQSPRMTLADPVCPKCQGAIVPRGYGGPMERCYCHLRSDYRGPPQCATCGKSTRGL